MTPEERIKNAKDDAEAHCKTLPDSMPSYEKLIEYYKYLSIRLLAHMREMDKHLINLTD